MLGAFLGNCALPSTKREGSTGCGGCARIYGRRRRRTAQDGKLTHKLPISPEQPLHSERRRISPALKEHRVFKGKTWLSISGCLADQRRPHRLQRRVCRLRWTKRAWRAMTVAAQTVAAAEAAAPSLDSYSVDGRCRRLEARDTRHRAAGRRQAAFTASSHAESSDGFCLFRARCTETRYSVCSSDHCAKRRERALGKVDGFWFFRCS